MTTLEYDLIRRRITPFTIACVALVVLLGVIQSISNLNSAAIGRRTVFIAKRARKVLETEPRKLDQTIREDDPLAPMIAWVMAYPCTGSDFIIDVLMKVTLKNIATNYGHLVEEATGILSRNVYESVPLFDGRENGPFLYTNHLALPVKTYIPTLTHCGGYCAHCYPGRYVMKRDAFMKKCLTGTRFQPSIHNNGENGYGITEEVQYDGDMVHKIGVVIRNPIDVISTRFMYYSNVYAGELDWTQRYDQSRDGFLTFCEESKLKFGDEEEKHWGEGTRAPGVEIPCYSEIYKIVMWQNNVCETLDYMSIPHKYIYYEDFFTDYETSAEELLDFYGLANVIPLEGTRPDQVRLNQKLYSAKEEEKVLEYISTLASDCTKTVFARYLSASE